MKIKSYRFNHDPSKILILIALFGIVFLINPIVDISFDNIYLKPKVLWIYSILLPSAATVIWRGKKKYIRSFRMTLLIYMFIHLIVIGLLLGINKNTWLGASDRSDGILMHLVYIIVAVSGCFWARALGKEMAMLLFSCSALIAGTLLSIINILQQISILGVFGEQAFQGIAATPFGGTLGHRGYMGGALALLLPCIIWLQPRLTRYIHWWGWITLTLVSWALVGSWSRGPWIAGAVGIAWLLFWNKQSFKYQTWLSIFIGLLLCFGSTKLPNSPARSFDERTITDGSGRSLLWKLAITGIIDRPLTGWGSPALWRVMHIQPTQKLEDGIHPAKILKRLDRNADQAPSFIIQHPNGNKDWVNLSVNKVHNEFLDYALTYGLPIAVIFTIIFLSSAWISRIEMPALSACIASYCTYLLTWPEVIRFAPIAWFIVGVTIVLSCTQINIFNRDKST